MTVAIVTDTCHYLPRERLEQLGVRQVSLYIHWGDEAQRESEITDYDQYYERLRTASQLPTTSQPSIGDFLEVYEPLLDEGHDLVSIHLAEECPERSARRSRRASSSALAPTESASSTRPPPAAAKGWSCLPRPPPRVPELMRRPSSSAPAGRGRS